MEVVTNNILTIIITNNKFIIITNNNKLNKFNDKLKIYDYKTNTLIYSEDSERHWLIYFYNLQNSSFISIIWMRFILR